MATNNATHDAARQQKLAELAAKKTTTTTPKPATTTPVKTTTLQGASAGGVAVQPSKTVNSTTGATVTPPKPIVLQGASAGGVAIQPSKTVDAKTGATISTGTVSQEGKNIASNTTSTPTSGILHAGSQGSPLNSTGITTNGDPTTTVNTTNTSEQIVNAASNNSLDSNRVLDEQKALTDAQISAEGEYKDTMIQLANEKYAQEQANLEKMQQLATDALANRNAALEAGAQQQRKDADVAMEFTKAQTELQRERTAKAMQQQILEQKATNTRRTLDQESKIATAGGFGNYTSNKLKVDSTVENDKLLNNLVFQKDISDREISAQLDNIHKEYTQNLNKIEVAKQTAIQQNYDKYLEYVQSIQNSKDMSQQAKDAAIANAAASYKTQIQKINSDSFQQRYTISTELADRAKQDLNDQKNDARGVLNVMFSDFMLSPDELTPAAIKQITALESTAGFPAGSVLANLKALKEKAQKENLQIEEQVNDDGDVTYVAIDKTTGKIVSQETLKGLAAITQDKGNWTYETDGFGNVVAFDSKTGEMKPISSMGNNYGYIQSGGGSTGTPSWTTSSGMSAVGDLQIPNEKFDEIFKIGQRYPLFNSDGSLGLGQCGVFASTCSTAGAVGDSWGEKKTRINKTDDFSHGDKLLMPMKDASGKVTSGHVAYVVSYNKSTGDIGVVESNADGKGTVRKHVYNVKKMNSLYGKGEWGAMAGKPEPTLLEAINGAGAKPLITGKPTTGVQPGGKNKVQEIMSQYGVDLKTAQEILKEELKTNATTTSTNPALTEKPNYEIAGVKTNPYNYSLAEAQKASEGQKKVAEAANAALQEEGLISAYEKAGIKTEESNNFTANVDSTTLWQPGSAYIMLENIKNSREKDLVASRMRWMETVLRKASGAAISIGEYLSYNKNFFPANGASAAEIKNKRDARMDLVKMSINSAGPAAAFIQPPRDYQIAPEDKSPVEQQINDLSEGFNDVGKTVGGWFQGAANAIQGAASDLQQSDLDDINNL